MLIALTFAAALVVGLIVTPIVREFAHRRRLTAARARAVSLAPEPLPFG